MNLSAWSKEEIITDKVRIYCNNRNTTEWSVHVCMYADEEKTTLHSAPIGYLTREGFVQSQSEAWKDRQFRMIWTGESEASYEQGAQLMMFLMRQRSRNADGEKK